MIQIMKASAGSGKTFNLARKYITLLFRKNDRTAYRHILAVTFTNKATDEMKNRILKELYILSTSPETSGYLKWFMPERFSAGDLAGVETEDIVKELPGRPGMKITLDSLRECAREMLCSILHDYSAFSVSTIDRFFQQTLKAFSREIGQFSSYQVELDKKQLIQETVDRILDSLTEDTPELLKWLTDCAMEQVESGGKYNLDQRLTEMAERLKSDAHREVAEQGGIDGKQVYSYANLQKIRKLCKNIISSYVEKVRAAARSAVDAIDRSGIQMTDFYKSFPKVLYAYADADGNEAISAPAVFLSRAGDPEMWFPKSRKKECMDQAAGLEDSFGEFSGLFGEEFRVYNTARMIEGQLYELGVAADIEREFDAVLKERNVLSIDDSNLLLKNIIDGSDAPFVYEKIGVRYENFLLDEFQDTSVIQWENFRPLLENSDSQGQENLIVGDVKQSIYRWRGSQWKLLQESLAEEFPFCRSTVLGSNFRSLRNIVEFNNDFFVYASSVLDSLYGGPEGTISDIYSDVRQTAASVSDEGGLVEVTFCDRNAQTELVLRTIRTLVGAGAGYGDIAVLVRNNSSGAEIAETLIRNDVPVITDDSLKVKSSSVVRRLVSLMTYMDNPRDTVGSYLAGSLKTGPEEGYRSLPDLCEFLVRSLGDADEDALDREATYVQSFVDCVLDYSAMNGNSLHDFLVYWDGVNPNISSPALGDAVRIITVHKSKGLDFRYVIFPFAETVKLYRPSNVWCIPDFSGTPLEEAGQGLFDVTLSESSGDTLFSGDFRREKLLQYIDNINIFYVALTRAVRGMYIIADVPSKKFLASIEKGAPGFSDMSHILYGYLRQAGLRAGFRAVEDTDGRVFVSYCLGEMPEVPEGRREKARPAETLPSAYPSFPLNPDAGDPDWPGGRNRLILSTENADYFSEEGKSGLYSSGRLRGIILHKILSCVDTAGDVSRAVSDAVASALLDAGDAGDAEAFLSSKIASVSSRGWFSAEGARILNETSVIDTDGRIYRPDRVILHSDGRVTVIDYKFGAKDSSHRRQIMKYADMWRRKGHPHVSAYLWYVMSDEIVE